jgi:hypothetical protein
MPIAPEGEAPADSKARPLRRKTSAEISKRDAIHYLLILQVQCYG